MAGQVFIVPITDSVPVAFLISGAKQNTPKKMLSDTRTGILGSIAGPC
jgi:hypothetical protein